LRILCVSAPLRALLIYFFGCGLSALGVIGIWKFGSETRDHLEMLIETDSLNEKPFSDVLCKRYDLLGRKINNFLQSVIAEQLAPKDQIGQQIFNDEND
jgi:hypothetical protein